jgi:hypothetical protein
LFKRRHGEEGPEEVGLQGVQSHDNPDELRTEGRGWVLKGIQGYMKNIQSEWLKKRIQKSKETKRQGRGHTNNKA